MDETKLAEALVAALNQSARENKRVAKDEESLAKSNEESKRRTEQIQELLKLNRTVKETGAAMRSREAFYKSIFTNQKVQYQDVTKELDDLSATLNKNSTQIERDIVRTKQNNTLRDARQANQDAAISNFTLGVVKASTQIGTTLVSAGGNFVKGLQDGQSSFGLSAGLMSGAVDVANTGVQAAAGGLQGLGSMAATSVNPNLRLLGIAAMGLGTVLGFVGNTASKLAKFGIEVLSKELEKSVQAYQLTSAAGALFADGLQGMRNAAGEAGLTVDQFSKVISANSSTIAASGLGVTEGAKRIGGALQAGGDTMKRQLLNLGYGFEEQAELVAQTMADMKGSSTGPLTKNNAMVAEQTQKYAENLRVIASITGEDAKKKMEMVREQASQLAFQQKLSKMKPDEQAGALRAMGNMSDLQRKNFMDMVNFGTVINKEGAVAAAMSSGLTNSVAASYKAFTEGKLNEEEQRQIGIQYGDQIKKDMLANVDIGLAGAAGLRGLVGELADSMGKELQFRNKFTEDAIKAAEAGVKAQENTDDPLTKSLQTAALAQQDLVLQLQKLLDPLIAGYAKVTAKMLEEIKSTFKLMRNEINDTVLDANGKPVESMWNKTKRAGGAALSGAVTAATIAAPIAGIAASTGVGAVPALIGAGVTTIGGAIIGGISEWFKDKEGKARGGVAQGSSSGYLEKLHGSEAVVPLPDGKSIPVTMQIPDAPVPNITVATPTVNVSPPTEQPSMVTSLFASAVDASAVLKDVLNSGVSKLKDMFDIQKPLSNIQPDTKSTDIASILAQQFKNLTTGFSDSNKLLKNTAIDNIASVSTGFSSGIASMLKGFIKDTTSQLGKQDTTRLSALTDTLKNPLTQLTAKTNDNISNPVSTTDLTLSTSEQRVQDIGSMVSSFIVDTSGKLTKNLNKFLSDVKESNAAAKPVVEPVTIKPLDALSGGLPDMLQKSNDSLREVLKEQTDLMKDYISKIDRLVDLTTTGNNINQQLLNTAY